MCCFYKRIMFSASGKFFCVYTEKNGMKHDEVENFSQLYFQEKRQIGSAAHLEAKIQKKKFVKTLLCGKNVDNILMILNLLVLYNKT